MVLGFFSFSNSHVSGSVGHLAEARIDTHEISAPCCAAAFRDSPLFAMAPAIDDVIRPIELHHVVDADSSEQWQSPSCCRSIARCQRTARDRQSRPSPTSSPRQSSREKVLFVAEKMAALDVVRAPSAGWIGTTDAGIAFQQGQQAERAGGAQACRDGQLRRHSDLSVIETGRGQQLVECIRQALHRPLEPSGLSPHAVLGLWHGPGNRAHLWVSAQRC